MICLHKLYVICLHKVLPSFVQEEKRHVSKPPSKSKEPLPPKKTNYKPDDFKLSITKRDSAPNIHGYDHFRTSSVSLERPTTQTRITPEIKTPVEI